MEIQHVSFGSDVVQALVADLEDELLAEYAGVPGSGGLPPPQVFDTSAGAFLLGTEAGRPVACGGIARYDDETAELRRMYVVPSARGRGLSRQLLTAIEDAARSLGYSRLRLETGFRQAAAIGLYRSAGFEPIDRYGPFADDERSLCFEKGI
ncbi:MAG TPA: GNAT family N-acetyltransferase [Gaiellaceae bacterium]|jgi:GNAT superfamily N-acetyltransferase|nr:GNAT family N-acetyltransferase [Gaiellaceae bacterium]